MKLAYLACPLTPKGFETREGNIAAAKEIYRRLSLEYPDRAFIAPWILNCEVFEETDEYRKKGMERNEFVIMKCDELWLGGSRISNGMREEVEYFKPAYGIEIFNETPDPLVLEDCEPDAHVLEGPPGQRICIKCAWAEWD